MSIVKMEKDEEYRKSGKPGAIQCLFTSEWTMIEVVIESLLVYKTP